MMTVEPGDEVGHVHQDLSGGWLRPAVFGAMDGLVTNIGLVAGVGGSGAGARLAVVTRVGGMGRYETRVAVYPDGILVYVGVHGDAFTLATPPPPLGR